MATYTQNYGLKMPGLNDYPDVQDFNSNAEIIDNVLKLHENNFCKEYSEVETYTEGQLCIRDNKIWKANQNVNAESWTESHWVLTSLAEEIDLINETIFEKGLSGGIVFADYSDFPRPGAEETLYVDTSITPSLMYVWDAEAEDYSLAGGAGGVDGSSKDIPLTLLSTGWAGVSAPYSQSLSYSALREGMTPLVFLQGQSTDEQIYAYGLLTDYQTGYGEITFYAADIPEVDIPVVLKGVPAQELNTPDNTVLVNVTASGFALSDTSGRYEQTVSVSGMTEGLGGSYDILRAGDVLSETESAIMASITDVQRLEGAIKIVCTEAPAVDFTLILYGTYKETTEGDVIYSDIRPELEEIKGNTADEYSNTATYSAGDYCIYGNVLYKAKQDISTAEEFTEAHWEQTTVASELSAVNSSTSVQLKEYIDLIHSGNAVHIEIYLPSTTYSAGWNTIGTVPEGLRPGQYVQAMALDNGTSSREDGFPIQLRITTSGAIEAYIWPTHLTAQIYGSVTYIIP